MLGSEQLYREAGYVGLSRGRLSNELFVVTGDEEKDLVAELAGQLSTSRAQSLALGQLGAVPDKRALLADPPPWAVEALGEPPVGRTERRHWAELAAELASLREAREVADLAHAKGVPELDERQRRAWEVAREMLEEERQRSLGAEVGLGL